MVDFNWDFDDPIYRRHESKAREVEEGQQALLEALLRENREAQLSLQRELGLPTESSSTPPPLPGPSRGVENGSAEVR